MRIKRCIKLLFCVTLCFFIGISLFRQLLHVASNTFRRLRIFDTEQGETYFDVGRDWFSLWNFTAMPETFVTSRSGTKRSNLSIHLFRRAIKNSLIGDYMKDKDEHCDGSFIGHAHLFAVLTNVLLDPSKAEGNPGGENIDDVINQDEEREYYKLSNGYFNLNCAEEPIYFFSTKDHLTDWMSAVDFQSNFKETKRKIMKRVTIAIQRYEYVNLYHTMTDFYNVFIMYLIFDLKPESTNILWIDGHPKGALDKTWKTLFSHIIRAGSIKNPIIFRTMIWNILGYYSLLNEHELENVPYLEEFRYFFLTRHNVDPYRKLNCSSVSVTFVWRRDYVAHPRNPEGHVQRKIENEDELITSLKRAFPAHKVQGYQLDTFPMQTQLQLIVETDIFIGMHGAGLTHAMFLPRHGALLELYPAPGSLPNHFKSIARWRGLRYGHWYNKVRAGSGGFTYVNPAVVVAAVKELTSQLCPNLNN